MDVTKCEAFLSAADRGSFTAAAEAMGYTQSGITRMINALEADLGFPLFIRQKKGVTLTENGRLMLPHLREIVRATRMAEELGADILGAVKGTITVGCYYSVSSMWMPEILTRFESRFPQVRVNMKEGGNLEIGSWLNEHAIDLCFGAKPAKGVSAEWIPLYKDEMVAWLPADHPKAHARYFRVKDFNKEPFIHTLPNRDTDQDRLIAAEKLTPNTRFSTRDGFTTYNMVEAGLGVSFNQRLISRKWHGRVALVPLKPAHYVELGIAVPSFEEASPAAKRFIACVKDILPELIEEEAEK